MKNWKKYALLQLAFPALAVDLQLVVTLKETTKKH